MLHALKYSIKRFFRQKMILFWSLLFPIILATMFNLAFGGLADDEHLNPIPVAVVIDSSTTKQEEIIFRSVIDDLGEEGDEQFLIVTYTDKENALSLLKEKSIDGILYFDGTLSLSVSTEMTNVMLEQSILDSFVSRYNLNSTIIKEQIANNPDNMMKIINQLNMETNYNIETGKTTGNTDEKLSYFFNLIAMACLFSSLSGLNIATNNQANLSAVSARKAVSSTPKIKSIIGELLADVLFQFLCVFVSLLYIILVLKIDFGKTFGLTVLAALCGCLIGISYGFFVGVLGNQSENIKGGILAGITMICCFLSGLMAGGMRMIVELHTPWFNRVNPAALISDSFYALTVYESYDRYLINIVSLTILSVILSIAGICVARRKRYAAL